jgi:hypothetical protein
MDEEPFTPGQAAVQIFEQLQQTGPYITRRWQREMDTGKFVVLIGLQVV